MDRPYDDGNHPVPPSKLRSPLLRRHARAIAQHSFDRIYSTWPELDERFGERGRHFIAEDNLWHLEHLDEVVAANDPGIFSAYADWLVGLLVPRGLDPTHVAGAFGFLAEALERVECRASMEPHRVAMIAILRGEQRRILARSSPSGIDGSDQPGTPLSPRGK